MVDMGSPEAQEAVRRIQTLSKASACLDSSQTWNVAVACEAGKEVLLRGAKKLVEDAAGAPVLSSKACDGTHICVAHRSSHRMPSGKKVRVSGRMGQEFLVKTQFLRSHFVSDGWRTCVLLSEPTRMAHGKSANAVLQASLKDWRTLRELGHVGCAVEHYAWDRAGITALERNTRQWHEQQKAQQDHLCTESRNADDLALTEFVVVTACAMHDCHNALRWSFRVAMSDTSFMRDVYVAVESLRNSMDLLSRYIGEWVALRLRYTPRAPETWVTSQRQLWQALGLEMETVEVLADDLQLRFADGVLYVSDQAPSVIGDDVVGTICACLLSAWRFRKWTESRWLTVGTSSRIVVAGLLLGLPDLVAHICADPRASLFYLKGFSRLAADRKQFLVQVSIASRVAEGLEAELLEDSRVARRLPDLWQAASEELQWVIGIDDAVWALLASSCDMRAADLKADCVSAAHISYHFLWRRILEPAGELPWSLVRGNVRDNLDVLAEGDPPEEPVSKQLWILLHAGFSKVQLELTVRLLGEIGWATVPAEQQHGSLAAFRRWHPEYGTETLLSRTMISYLARLLPGQSSEEKRIAKVVQLLRAASKRQPEKAGGRQAFLKGLMLVAQAQKQSGHEALQIDDRRIAKMLFARHAWQWAAQSLRTQQEFTAIARRDAGDRREAITKDVQALSAELDLLNQRLVESHDDGRPLCMSSASLNDASLEVFNKLVNDEVFRAGSRIQRLRKAALEPPLPLPPSKLRDLERIAVWQRPEQAMPRWSKQLADHRDEFQNAAVVVPMPDGSSQTWLLLYCVQRPYYVGVARLHPVEVFHPPLEEGAGLWDVLDAYVAHRYRVNYADMATAADIPDAREEDMGFLRNLRYEGGLFLSTQCEPRPLTEFLENLPEKIPNERKTAETAPAQVDGGHDQLLLEYPWLQYLDMQKGYFGDVGKSKQPGSSTDLGTAEDVELDEADMAMLALAAVEAARAAEPSGGDLPCDDFVVRVRGDTPMRAMAGEAVDAIQGAARNEMARDWCRRRGLNVTFRAGFANHTRVDCGILVRGWCRRMQFFYEMELTSDEGFAFAYSPDRVASFEESTEFLALAERGKDDHRLMARVAQIRAILS